MNNNTKLYNYCNWNKLKKLSNILSSDTKLNILQEEGECLVFAAKYKNAAMMEALLKYFYEAQLTQIQNKYLQKDTENKLKKIIEEVVDSWIITEEIDLVFNKYLNMEKFDDIISSENNSIFSLDETLENKVLNHNYTPKKHLELKNTTDTGDKDTESNKSAKSDFSLEILNTTHVLSVINHYHLDSSFHINYETQIIGHLYNDDYNITYCFDINL